MMIIKLFKILFLTKLHFFYYHSHHLYVENQMGDEKFLWFIKLVLYSVIGTKRISYSIAIYTPRK